MHTHNTILLRDCKDGETEDEYKTVCYTYQHIVFYFKQSYVVISYPIYYETERIYISHLLSGYMIFPSCVYTLTLYSI